MVKDYIFSHPRYTFAASAFYISKRECKSFNIHIILPALVPATKCILAYVFSDILCIFKMSAWIWARIWPLCTQCCPNLHCESARHRVSKSVVWIGECFNYRFRRVHYASLPQSLPSMRARRSMFCRSTFRANVLPSPTVLLQTPWQL